jgi:hypothetical protein
MIYKTLQMAAIWPRGQDEISSRVAALLAGTALSTSR